MTDELLFSLREQPLSLEQLCRQLGHPRGQIESALRILQRGRYVDQAIPDQGVCRSGCGGCNVKNLCPSSLNLAPQGETWRLTDKGLARVTSPT